MIIFQKMHNTQNKNKEKDTMRYKKQHRLTTKSKGKKFQDYGCTVGQERNFIFRPE